MKPLPCIGWRVVTLASAVFVWPLGVPAADSRETIVTRAYVEKTGAEEGRSRVEIVRATGVVQYQEERSGAGSPPYQYAVAFDPMNLRPATWVRRTIGKDERVEISMEGDRIESRTLAGQRLLQSSSLPVPPDPWCLAPLMKFLLARCVAAGSATGLVHYVNVTADGSLKVTRVALEDLGRETVVVPAGEYACRRVRLVPQSSLMSALVPPGEMFIGEGETLPMVKTLIRPTRFSSTIATVMEEHRIEPLPGGAP